MMILLMISRSLFLVSVVLYLYYFFRRKKHDVVIQMWLSIYCCDDFWLSDPTPWFISWKFYVGLNTDQFLSLFRSYYLFGV